MLHSRGLDFDCYEVGSGVGGNWRYENDNGMSEVIRREDARMAKRYVASKRHTIQVDFLPYMRALKRERRKGLVSRIRATRSREVLGSARS